MSELKMTKNALRDEEKRFTQLEKYLPTLQLKKALLQLEINEARLEILEAEERHRKACDEVDFYVELLTEKSPFNPLEAMEVVEVLKRYENIAGVEVPFLDGIVFRSLDYSLLDTPPWIDGMVEGLRRLKKRSIEIEVIREKKKLLEEELRQVSIRVNLFEKVLIPRALRNIKKIKVFLGDQQLAAVGQVKVAKVKIEERKELAKRRVARA